MHRRTTRVNADLAQQELSVMAKELGAAVESALTIAVTHVVASGYGSAKYLVCSPVSDRVIAYPSTVRY